MKAFTFIEIIIVIALLAILAIIFVGSLNPFTQIKRSWDGKRKSELSTIQKVLEDWYNDKGRFPQSSEICFDSASSSRIDDYGKTACYCQICGKNSASPQLPQLPQLPCDPQSTTKEYLYDFDCSGSNPSFYRIYTKLSIEDDPAVSELGCQYGCGPASAYAYNYGVSSGADLERKAKNCTLYNRIYQKDDQGFCNICKSLTGGDVCNWSKPTYVDTSCIQPCITL